MTQLSTSQQQSASPQAYKFPCAPRYYFAQSSHDRKRLGKIRLLYVGLSRMVSVSLTDIIAFRISQAMLTMLDNSKEDE